MHLNSEAGGANDPIAAVAALKSLQPDLARRALYAIRLGRLEVNIYHCNTAISVTGKNGNLWPDVLGLLERIRTWLVKPTASTFNAAIAAQGCQDSSWSRSIDIWRSMKAVQVEPDVITQNSLAARCNADREGRWQLALDLAGGDVVGIGTRLAACEVGGCWLLSLELLRTLASDVVLNRVLCNAVISVCASCGKWQHALLLLASMFGWSVRADTADFNAAMSAAAKSDGSQWALAFSIQEKLVQSRLVPSEVTVNTAIAASEQGDKWELALQLKQGMTRWQLVPSPVTWVASVSSTAREWPVSLSVLEIMCQEEPFPGNLPFRAAVIASWCHALGLAQSSITSCNAAMTACRNQGKWQAVLLLFQQTRGFCLQPTDVTFLASISGCEAAPVRSDQWGTAISLLFSMSSKRLPVDSSHFNSAISACEKAGQWQLAVWLLQCMRDLRIQKDEISYNSVISAFSKGSEWELALALLFAMSTTATVITYNAAITACEKAGSWEMAVALLFASPATDTVSWSAAISACEKAGQWTQALELLSAMKVAQVRANVITFNASISACEKGREWPAALCMLEAMRGGATVQDQISFSAAVSACEKTGKWRRVLQVVRSMQTATSLNQIVYNAAIGACEKGPIPAFFDGFHRYTESSSLVI